MVYNKPMAYPTLSNLKSVLKITDASADYALQLSLDSAIAWVEEFTGRSWSGTPVSVVDEEYDLDNFTQTTDGSYLTLRNMDIVTLTSVKLGTLVQATDTYTWNSTGRLVLYGRFFDVTRRAFNDNQYVKVSYTYGAVLNKAVEGAIVMLAMAYWNDQLGMSSTSASTGLASDANSSVIKREKVGETDIMYGGGNLSATDGASNLASSASAGTINSITRLLNNYRRRRA